MKKFILWLIIIIFAVWCGKQFFSKTIEVPKEIILDNLTEKINQLKGSLVNDIRQCESNGYNEDDGLITFDPHKTNKSIAPASIGLYQWKVASIKYYYKTLYNKDITNKNAVLIALDEQKSNELTSDVIFKTDKGLDNWINCSNKINAKSRLEVIKQLEK